MFKSLGLVTFHTYTCLAALTESFTKQTSQVLVFLN
jgi:hypothetical protein